MENSSKILIVNDIELSLKELIPQYPNHSTRIIKNEDKDEFLLAQANAAIKEAYIATKEIKYIFLCGATFRNEAQNALLKILEEPPKNVVFIILVSAKSSLLPTIYSRIPYKNLKTSSLKEESSLDIKKLDLKDIYTFLKENQKLSKSEAKELIESILLKVNKQELELSKEQLELFSKASKLIELNSKATNVLTMLLLSLQKQN